MLFSALASAPVETRRQALLAFIQAQRRRLRPTFGEGAHAVWLYDLLAPYVCQLMVCDPQGSFSADIEASARATACSPEGSELSSRG